jgi:hypothetical protein
MQLIVTGPTDEANLYEFLGGTYYTLSISLLFVPLGTCSIRLESN